MKLFSFDRIALSRQDVAKNAEAMALLGDFPRNIAICER
jgi:hypothetical protein